MVQVPRKFRFARCWYLGLGVVIVAAAVAAVVLATGSTKDDQETEQREL